jgi:hypothetical protein
VSRVSLKVDLTVIWLLICALTLISLTDIPQIPERVTACRLKGKRPIVVHEGSLPLNRSAALCGA